MKIVKIPCFSLLLIVLGLQACKKSEVIEPEIISTKKSWTDTVEVYKLVIGVKGQNKLDWSWNNPDQDYIAVNYLNSLGGIVSRNITLPWKTQGNVLNVPKPDINTEDGWDIFLINFGTIEQPVTFPFFAVYNKKTSTLRCFIYNSQRIAANDFVGKLTYDGTNSNHSLLISKIKAYRTKANTFDSWINLDFSLTHAELTQFVENNSLGIDVRCLSITI